ncbi:MAG: hypothetical protein AAGI03_15390 [Pseudomonadota bacterium]
MPNTLAHMGLQALVTRRLIANADLGWIWLGCLLPDAPWILQRVVHSLPVAVSKIDLRLYAVVQSSLFFSLIAAAAFTVLAPRPLRAFAIVAFGCALHLVLDALQTKWANGVLLFAPLDWHLLNFGLFWPDDWLSLALSATGFCYLVLALRHLRPSPLILPKHPKWRIGSGVCFLSLYLAGPLLFMPAAEAENLHYAATLRNVEERTGQSIGFDRSDVIRASDGVPTLSVWSGETLQLSGETLPASVETVSIRGRFENPKTVSVEEFHEHVPVRREVMTIAALAFMALWWLWSAIHFRVSDD